MKAKVMLEKIKEFNDEAVVYFDADKRVPARGIIYSADSLLDMVSSDGSAALYILDAAVRGVNIRDCVKVGELKEILAANPDTCVRGMDGCEILYVEQLNGGNVNDFIWLETENDIDMSAEISAIWSEAITLGLDEDYVYGGMIERGITPAMVRKYDSPKQAAHMAEYCVEHGLMPESDLSDDDICVLGEYSDGRTFAIPKNDTSQLFREIMTSTGSARDAQILIKWLRNPGCKCRKTGCQPLINGTGLTIALIPAWEAAKNVRPEKEYTVRVTRYGYATITASSIEEAIETACGMNPEEFEWGGLNDAEIV